jgi:hypothetical protein
MNGITIDYTVRKTATKTHRVKVGEKQHITFLHYRSMLLGKYDLTYFNTVDLILDVKCNEWGLIDYTVTGTEDNRIRNHGTYIDPKDVSIVNKWQKKGLSYDNR